MVSRGIITYATQLCTSGCGEVESSYHFILNYNIFGSFWFLVRDLLGFSLVYPRSISDHFVHYAHLFVHYARLTGGSRVRRSFMHLIWFAYVWVIWQERNDTIFKNTKKSMTRLLDKVKYMSF